MSAFDYEPYLPQLAPKRWAEGIWKVEGPEVRYSLLGITIPCPTRMTVVRLPNDRLWLHSPVTWSDELDQELGRLGKVAAIVAPNSFHHLHVAEWAAAHPQAAVYAAPDLPRRRVYARAWHSLQGEAPSAWHGVIEQSIVDLGRFVEAIFFHRPSRTLIVTDLMQNFEQARVADPVKRALLRLGGASGPVGGPSIEIRLAALGRTRALEEAVAQMIAWGPASIILSHGQCYADHAMQEIVRAFPTQARKRPSLPSLPSSKSEWKER